MEIGTKIEEEEEGEYSSYRSYLAPIDFSYLNAKIWTNPKNYLIFFLSFSFLDKCFKATHKNKLKLPSHGTFFLSTSNYCSLA